MKPKKYSAGYAKLSNLILSMPEEQHAKLHDLALKMQNGENLFEKKGRKNHIRCLGRLGTGHNAFFNFIGSLNKWFSDTLVNHNLNWKI